MPPTQLPTHRPRYVRDQQLLARLVVFFICILMVVYPTITLLRSDTSRAKDVKLATEDYGIDIDPAFNGAEKHLSYPILRADLLERSLELDDENIEKEVDGIAVGRISRLQGRTWTDSDKKNMDRLVESTGQYWDMAVAASPDLRLEPLKYVKPILLDFEGLLRSSAPDEEDIADILKTVQKRLRQSFTMDPSRRRVKRNLSMETLLHFHRVVDSIHQRNDDELLDSVDGISKSALSLLAARHLRFQFDAAHKATPRVSDNAEFSISKCKTLVTKFYRDHPKADIQRFLELLVQGLNDMRTETDAVPSAEKVGKVLQLVNLVGEWISSSSTQDLIDALEMIAFFPWGVIRRALSNVTTIPKFTSSKSFVATSQKAFGPGDFGQFIPLVTKAYQQAFNQSLDAQDARSSIETSIAAATAAVQYITQKVQSQESHPLRILAHKRDSPSGAVATTPWPPSNSTSSSGSMLHPSRTWPLSQWLIFGASITIFGSLFLITLVGCIRRCRSKSRTRLVTTQEPMSMKYGHPDKKTHGSQNTLSSLQPTTTTINSPPMGLDGVHDGWTQWLTSKPRSELKVAKRGGNFASIRPPRLPTLRLPKPTFYTVRKASGLDVDIENTPQVKRVKWGSTV